MYIAIAGNIGSGKTTLTEILTRHYNAKAYYEESNNPYIGDFYNDMQRWAFHLQIYFLGSRIQQTLDMLASGDDVIVQDRTIYEDAHIFADNLAPDGADVDARFGDLYGDFPARFGVHSPPRSADLSAASVPTLTAQIRKRGRDYEMNIDEDYLCRLNAKYEHWVNDIYDGEVLLVDKDTEDFVENPAVLEKICRRIDRLRNEQKR